MKKLRIITIIIAVVLLASVLASCTLSARQVFNAKTYTVATLPDYTSADELDDFMGYDVAANNVIDNGLIVFSKTDTSGRRYVVYDVVGGAKSVEFYADSKTNYTFDFFQANGIDFYMVTKERELNTGLSEYTYELYARNSSIVDSFTTKIEEETPYSVTFDLIYFNDTVYRVADDGSIKVIYAVNELNAGMQGINQRVKDYYYNVGNWSTAVYNLDSTLRFKYTVPAYAISPRMFVLQNGNIFVQYRVQKAETDNDYDLVMDGANGAIKYDLVQQIINVKSGNATKVNNKYFVNLITIVQKGGEYEGLNKSIKNVAQAYAIKDKRMDDTNDNIKYVSFSNAGKVGGILNDTLDGERSFDIISKDRIVITDQSNRRFLVDYKGKNYGEVSNSIDIGEKYIVSAQKIYDMSLNVLFEYASKDYQYENMCGDSVILSDINGIYYIFNDKDTTPVEIGKVNKCTFLYRAYVEKNTSTDVSKLYNAHGEELISKAGTISSVETYTDKTNAYMVVLCYSQNVKHYYIVK